MGHDVVHAAQLGLARAQDAELLRVVKELGRNFVTRDRDLGAMVFVQGSGRGVVYLRILPSTQNAVHVELERVLALYSEQEIQASTAFYTETLGFSLDRQSLPALVPARHVPPHRNLSW